MSYLAVELSDEVCEALRDVAARRGKTVPEIVREALMLYLRLAMYDAEPPRPVKREW